MSTSTSPEFLTREQLGERYGKTPTQVSNLVAREKRKGNVVRMEGKGAATRYCLDDYRRFCGTTGRRSLSESTRRYQLGKARR